MLTRPQLFLALAHLCEVEADPDRSRNRGDPAHDEVPSPAESRRLRAMSKRAARDARRELAHEVGDWFTAASYFEEGQCHG